MFFLHDFCFKSRQMTVTIIRNPWIVAEIVMVVLMVLRTPMAHCREAPRKSWTTTLQQSQIWELISWGLWGLGLGVFFSDKIPGRIWKVCYHCPNFSSLEKIILLDSSLTFCNWKEDTSLWKKTLGFQSWKRESAFQYQMQDRMRMAPLDKQSETSESMLKGFTTLETFWAKWCSCMIRLQVGKIHYSHGLCRYTIRTAQLSTPWV